MRESVEGTALLAKQSGASACVACTFDSIFKLVLLHEKLMRSSMKNTGEGKKRELTNLNIVGPANTADYEIKM